ncbi:MAG TPA: orotidine-5'-phosphate decarboxylase [Gammaproteobacteria bacterium]|nr:orotidine-5'-phosphate decarboxylase [Gammaproteobacteria bacterium]
MPHQPQPPNRIIVALDYPDPAQALALADKLEPTLCRLKVGKELFTTGGPEVVRQLRSMGFDIFLDLKFHDIPNTVAKACSAAAGLGVWMLNIHALGGRRMMEAAREALENCVHRPLLIAVTILTSMDEADIRETGLQGSVPDNVMRLADLARAAGIDGVVCSANEASLLKARFGQDFQLITPGIRPAGSASQDQKRITTPAQALANGSDFLVIGRAITGAENPTAALNSIQAEICGALAGA